ncbi:MAG TPA: tRNA (adenosine(37)-N6)-dimethylallyltransferase MiaA [Bacteroidales bacterium]|nr:tRNA (adenosine(37)-N6)-dimethylallyltransferase MiaA [Bacteroidales bacterium]
MDAKNSSKYDLLVVTGPTASGKTSLAAALALKLNGEVISADSRQVYRHMNLGTGKDYNDYVVEGRKIPYHLVDIADPGYKYSVFEYQQDFIKVLADLRSRNVFPVVCGGSGLYIDSVVSGYKMTEVPPDPEFRASLETRSLEELTKILSSYKKLHNRTDTDTKKRAIRAIEIEHFIETGKQIFTDIPEVKPLVTGVLFGRDIRRERISERLKSRLEEGMVDEVKHLLAEGIDPDILVYYGLEYKYITHYITGRISYEEMYTSLETAIHQFAKRQMTWFRGMERRGIKIHWIDGELPMNTKVEQVMELLA